jgi:hypothetical protein
MAIKKTPVYPNCIVHSRICDNLLSSLFISIRKKITRKIIIFYLGGWKARGIPKGGFGRVLARKEKR